MPHWNFNNEQLSVIGRFKHTWNPKQPIFKGMEMVSSNIGLNKDLGTIIQLKQPLKTGWP